MKTVRVVFLALLAVLLFFAACTLPLLYTASSRLLKPEFYLGVLDSQATFDGVAAGFQDLIQEGIPGDMAPEVREAFREGLAAALTPGALREVCRTALERVCGFLTGAYPDPVFVISVEPARAAFIETVLAALPRETVEQERAELGVPPGVTDEEFVASVLALGQEGELSVAEEWERFPGKEAIIETIRTARLVRFGGYAPAGLLFLLCLLCGGVSGGLRWAGGAVLLAGLFALAAVTATIILGLPVLGSLVRSQPSLPLPDLDLAGLATAAARDLAAAVRLAALVLAGAGLALWLAAPLFRRRRPTPPRTSQDRSPGGRRPG